MTEITINLNTKVNPCIVTTQGDYCLKNHSLYLSCQYPSRLYQKYGWYLGNITVGNNQLDRIPRKQFAGYLQLVEGQIDTLVSGNINQVGSLLYDRISGICKSLNKICPEYTFMIQDDTIRVPEVKNGFHRCLV